MTDSQASTGALDDIGYLRALAEQGHQAPLLGGRFAVMWGVLVSAALIFQWLVLTARLPVHQSSLAFSWIGMALVGGLGSAFLVRSLRDKPGTGSVGNRAEHYVWGAGGTAIFVYFIAVIAGFNVGNVSSAVFDTIMPMAFCIYGVCYITTGGLSGNRALLGIAGLCFIGAIGTGAFMGQPIAALVAAVFVVLTTIIPGIVQMRSEPAQIV